MRIKTQLLISIITFSIILVIIGSSVALTQTQITELNNQSALTNDIQTGTSDLNYISNNYFLSQDNSYLTLWQTKFSTLSNELARLNSSNLQQQALVNTVSRDLENINSVFAGVTTFLSNAPKNESIRTLPSFQIQWNRLAVQVQALSFDSQQLSQNIQERTNQAILTNTVLIVALLSIFGMFFITIYFVAYRRTARSITKLKNGIGVIGSGNLDYKIEAGKKDEIEDISKSVNQMATNLKTVTASKTDLEQAQASLRESEQRWATTLASIGDAVIATDNSGIILFMNGEAEKLTGWGLSEVSKKPVRIAFNIINEQTRLEVESPIERVLRDGIVVGLANHTVLIRKDGSEVPIDDSGAPIKDKDGKTTGVVLIFRDITERKNAEEALQYNEKLLSGFFDSPGMMRGIVEIIDGREVKHLKDNVVTASFLGLKPSDLEGKLSSDLGEPAERIKVWIEHYKQSQETNKPVTWEYSDTEGSNKTWLSPTVTYIGKSAEGNPRFTYIVANIAERKKAEEKLEEYRDNLEKQVEERTKQLRDSERLAAIGATAGMVGHDIRNPLQAITGDVYLAKSELDGLPDGEEKQAILESLIETEKNVDYINKIVQDLQDYARPLNPNPGEADLKLLIDKLLTKNGIPKNVKLTVNLEPEARKFVADADYLNRILYNLITNAVQAMPKGGKLTITARNEANDIVVAVKDTGVGIPKEIQGKMFTPMFTTKSKGQGFGLPVVKRMTESLGGTVSFESEEGKGTTFIVRFAPPKR